VTIRAYEIVLEIDGQDSTITLDDTFPAIVDWHTACTMAVLMAKHVHPECEIEFISCTEYDAEEYDDYGYIFPAPMQLH
jgi:hypothetical protein